MAEFKSNFFEHNEYYLGHKQAELMFDDPSNGETLLKLSKIVSECLHEDWRANIIKQKGPNGDHFRPVKDDNLTKAILENEDLRKRFLALEEKGTGKKLFKIVPKEVIEKQEDGSEQKKIVEEVQFDLMRMKFEDLTQAWQDANLKAAKFAIALIKTGLNQNALQGTPQEVFTNFEKMSHDVHIEWMIREKDWGDARLFFPYELLSVNDLNNGEKQKDRDQLLVIFSGLSFQSNILAKNRSIVLRALKEVLNEQSNENGINQEIVKNLESIDGLIKQQNEIDYARCQKFKSSVKKQTLATLKNKESLTFEDLEKICAIYYEEWKKQSSQIMKLPKEYDASYSDLLAMDTRLNFKNAARMDMADLIKEMISENQLNPALLQGINDMNDPESDIAKKISKQNEEDFANYNTQKSLN